MIQLENVTYRYGGTAGHGGHNGVTGLNLTVGDGEFVVLCGKSGCGKTTVTRIINGLIPAFYEGEFAGRALVNGLEVSREPLSKTAAVIGSVFQNPKSQFFNVDTTGELAFGCENQAMPREEIRARVQETAALLQLEKLLGRSIFELSGGEKQQIACGSVYAAHPQVLVLDEPSSNLDAAAIVRLQAILQKLKALGKTIVVSEHRLYYLTALADRFCYFSAGRLQREYTPAALYALTDAQRAALGLRCTALGQLAAPAAPPPVAAASPPLCLQGVRCMREKRQILEIPELTLPAGAVVALIGENGAGKSTLAECLCGVLSCKGQFALGSRPLKPAARTELAYLVMQDVNHQLFCDSVLAEVTMNLPPQETPRAQAVLEQLDLTPYTDAHPAALSGGQKQRVAIAAALCAHKQIFLYDEPTSGLDYDGMQRLGLLLRQNAQAHPGSYTLVITHDMELIFAACTHVLHLDAGRVKAFYPLDEAGCSRVRQFFLR